MKIRTAKDLILSSDITTDEANNLLRRYDFKDLIKADNNLQRLAGEPPTRQLLADIVEVLLQVISESPDPDAALNNLERFANVTFDRNMLYGVLREVPALMPILATIFGSSEYLSDTLIRNPEYFEWLMEPDVMNQPKDWDIMYRELSQMVNIFPSLSKKLNAIRRYKRREALRIGTRDLLQRSDLETTTQELSNLADSSLQIAYELAVAELTLKLGEPQSVAPDGKVAKSAFAVIGMGKLGGCELNFSSDIDVMFVYSADGQTKGGVDNRQYFTKMSEFITNALSKITEEGYVFRVDVRLRPESSAGSIVRSLDSYEAYYESWGEIWERQALIKSRPVAGDAALGQAFMDMIEPFVYQRYMNMDTIELIIEDIRQTKARIERRIGSTQSHVKLGVGGIRDIEFIVQGLQLIYSGRDKELRERNTLRAIDLLHAKGHIDEDELNKLAAAYRFLRTVEHRLQIIADRQLHVLPEKKGELNKLARRMGYLPVPLARQTGRNSEKDGEAFLRDYAKHTSYVREIYQKVFPPARAKSGGKVEMILESKNTDEIAEMLKPYNFRDVTAVHKQLHRLADGGDNVKFTPKTRRLFLDVAPTLLTFASESPDPDMALKYFERFLDVAGARASYYKLFSENPSIIELLAKLCGTSKFLSEILIQNPELLDILTRPDLMSHRKAKKTMRAELDAMLKRTRANPFETFRKYKNGEVLRIGIRDILGSVELRETTEELSNLAEVILQCAYEILDANLQREWGFGRRKAKGGKRKECNNQRSVLLQKCKIPNSEFRIPNSGGADVLFAIIGMGKLGGRELNYNSDLDLIFAYSVDGEMTTDKSNYDYFTKLGQELVIQMANARGGGPVYEIDLRLRPFGKAGSIALSLQGYQNYYEKHGETWERQALIKARPVAGDFKFGGQFMRVAHEFAYNQPLTTDQIAEIVHTRMRKEDKTTHTRARKRTATKVQDVKIGYGGITDIEFIVQTLQLVAGCHNLNVRSQNTLIALEQLSDAGALSAAHHRELSELYQFLRMVENRLRIVHDRPLNALPTEEYELEKLAKRLGYTDEKHPATQRFMQDYQDCTNKTRELFNEILK